MKEQIDAIQGAPILYLGALVVVALAIWGIVHWIYRHRIESLKERIDALKDGIDLEAPVRSPSRRVTSKQKRPIHSQPNPKSIPAPDGRVFLPTQFTPKSILDEAREMTTHEAELYSKKYLGKWIRLSGSISDVRRRTSKGWTVMVDVDGSRGATTFLDFDDSETGVVEILRKGQKIRVEGQISEIMKSWITLNNPKLDF